MGLFYDMALKEKEGRGAEAERLGSAIRGRRKEVGLTQAALAEMVGFSVPQTVSDLERGERQVKAWELVRIAAALRTSADRLLGLEGSPRAARVMWRRGSPTASREAEELFLDRARRYALLERWNHLPPAPRFPEYRLDPVRASFSDAADLARLVGRTLDLGSRPGASLSSVLQEGFQVKLFFEELGDDESAAAAKGDFGCAILLNSSQAPWRRNYSLAHEVFHLVTWDSTLDAWGEHDEDPEWLERIEKLANAFASHLLLPSAELEAEFGARFPDRQVIYADLVEMAREFEVSTEALVWRLKLKGRFSQSEAEEILGDPEFRTADRRTMPGHWTGSPTGPLPSRYWRLALGAYHRGEVSLGRLAKLLETSVSELGPLVLDDADGPEATASPD